jgi:predicted phosphodiesterase
MSGTSHSGAADPRPHRDHARHRSHRAWLSHPRPDPALARFSLHGHIHESRGAQRLGRTLCLNPGSEYQDGVSRAALIDFQGENVRNYLLVSA